MNCPDCEQRIAELLERGADPEHDPAIGSHVADCPKCRAFGQTWSMLNDQLVGLGTRARVPEGFAARLFTQLPPLAPRLSPGEKEARHRELEVEHQAALARLQRRYLLLDFATLLRFSSALARLAVGLVLLAVFVESMAESSGAPLVDRIPSWYVPAGSVVIGLAALVYGVSLAWAPWRRLRLAR